MKLKFWGTRGSIPVNGKNYCKYGGNTPCVEIIPSEEFSIIFDAGSGIRDAGNDFENRQNLKEIFILFSHFHTDHVIGLPFFKPFYNEKYFIKIYGLPYIFDSIEKIIDLIVSPPLFVLTKDNFKAKVSFQNLTLGENININGIKISTLIVNHPNPTIGYKVTQNNKTIIYITDNELIQNNHSLLNIENNIRSHHSDLINFCKDANVLIHDSTYNLEDYNQRIGWGHSSIFASAMLAHLAGVKHFFLFHYDPTYNDERIDLLLKLTNDFLSQINSRVQCHASSDFLEIEV